MPGSLVLLHGPPAAGKSSLARDVLAHYRAFGGDPPLIYLSTDQLREAISGPVFLGSIRPSIYRGIRTMAESALTSGHHVLVDGNYLESRYRLPLVNLLRRKQMPLLRVLVCCSLQGALRRNQGRTPSERVPEDYLRKVYARVEEARQQADVTVDTEVGGPDPEPAILEFLLGSVPQGELPTSEQLLEREWEKRGQLLHFKPGQAVWRAGETSLQVIWLRSGELEVIREVSGQPPVVIHRLTPGEMAGELSSLDGSPHSATLRACAESQVAALDAAQFRTLLRQHKGLLDRVLQGMVGRIRDLSGAAGHASVDLLSGLGNRRMLEELMPALSQRASRDGQPLSLAVFDIDRFKGVNDSYGHEAGDAMIRAVAQHLQACIPPPGVCLRYGGDEFVVLLPGLGPREAMSLLEGFSQSLRVQEFEVGSGLSLRATISLGVASFPDPLSDCQQLFACADAAAYASKKAGRDRVTAYQAGM